MPKADTQRRPNSASPWPVWPYTTLVLLAFACASGLLLLILTQTLLIRFSTTEVAKALADFILGIVPRIGNALDEPAENLGLALWLEARLPLSSFLIGFFIGVPAFWKLSRKVALGLFAPMDASVALPISAPVAALEPLRPVLGDFGAERPMPWVEPVDGPRSEVWQQLSNFALSEGEKFEYQLLLGGPGAGKTRMSIEFARRILGKLGATDDGKFILHGRNNIDLQMTRRQRLRSWWRIRVLGRDPVPDDIWHIGWFSPEALSKSDARTMVKGQLGRTLDNWRPTRPTFLLLDDPLHEDSAFVVETLNKNAVNFRHRVRLLIANQTVPGDLRIIRAANTDIWQSQVREAFRAPLVLSAKTPLADREIRLLAGNLPSKVAFPILNDAGLRAFKTITRGNPLLVELGLSWLLAGKQLPQMTEEALLEDRSRRFLQAIKTAGFEAGQGQLIDLLTMVTVANGSPTTMPDGQETIWTIFGVQRIDRENAARLFPTEVDIDLRSFLPPVRPQTMAIAFARAAMADLEPIDRNRIIRTAWRANPRGTLRTLLRIDGGYKSRVGQEDPLQSTFNTVPMEVGLPPFDLFCLLAQASCSAIPEDWEDGNYHLGASLLDKAIAECHRLSGDELPHAFAFVVDLILGDRGTRMLRETNAAVLFAETLGSLHAAGRLFEAKVLDNLARWAASPRAQEKAVFHGIDFSRVTNPVISPPVGTTLRLFDMSNRTYRPDVSSVLFKLMAVAANTEENLSRSELLWRVAMFNMQSNLIHMLGDPSERPSYQRQFEDLCEDTNNDVALSISIYRSYVAVLALDGRRNAELISQILERATQFISDSNVLETTVFLLLQLQREVASANKHDPRLCRDAADRVEALAMRFPDSAEFQEQWAMALCIVSGANQSDAELCYQIADRVEAIAHRFPDHEGMQCELSSAIRLAVSSSAKNSAHRIRLEDRINIIARNFPDLQRVHQELASVCALVSQFSASNAGQCILLAEQVYGIVERFPTNAGLALSSMFTWKRAIFATLSEPARCRLLADRAEALALRFLDLELIQRERAEAWSLVSYATRSDPVLCRQMADRVAAIALRFPDNEEIQKELAVAWRHVSYATMSDPALCRQMADRVEAIALRFPKNSTIQEQARLAASYVPQQQS